MTLPLPFVVPHHIDSNTVCDNINSHAQRINASISSAEILYSEFPMYSILMRNSAKGHASPSQFENDDKVITDKVRSLNDFSTIKMEFPRLICYKTL